jgi:hypothetical protein
MKFTKISPVSLGWNYFKLIKDSDIQYSCRVNMEDIDGIPFSANNKNGGFEIQFI